MDHDLDPSLIKSPEQLIFEKQVREASLELQRLCSDFVLIAGSEKTESIQAFSAGNHQSSIISFAMLKNPRIRQTILAAIEIAMRDPDEPAPGEEEDDNDL